MGGRLKKLCVQIFKSRLYCTRETNRNTFNCKLLIVGGGAGGFSVAWRLSKHLRTNDIIVIEPSQIHYYQPLFTLIAAGIKNFQASHKQTLSLLPSNIALLQDRVAEFEPDCNEVRTECGNRVVYEHMVVAVGLVNDYDQISGFKQALDSNAPVTTIYSPSYCTKTWKLLNDFKGGNAVFTYPSKAGKCSGAAQKIMYLAHDFWKWKKVLNQTSINYVTGGTSLFGIPKYGAALTKIAAQKGIVINTKLELAEITPTEACFVDATGRSVHLPYKFLHVAPIMAPPTCLVNSKELANPEGFLDVNKYSLRHNKYENVYGLGDCTSTPNSKTAAAVVQQSPIVASNLLSTMAGKEPTAAYNGYGACPVMTSYSTGILTEFLYDKEVRETFPCDQSKESWLVPVLSKYIFEYLYWNRLLKGKSDGATTLRKIINPFNKN